tara:strand:+ start:342 stop:680 length:339 start_codon:yes stop_codon:yes gene_type:complete
MAITKVWEVNKCRFETADKYIYEVIYRVKGMDGTEEKWRETGAVQLPKPSTLIAYDTLDAATVIGWVKAKIDADAAEMGGSTVADIEKKIDDAIAELNAPTTAEGTPWAVSE